MILIKKIIYLMQFLPPFNSKIMIMIKVGKNKTLKKNKKRRKKNKKKKNNVKKNVKMKVVCVITINRENMNKKNAIQVQEANLLIIRYQAPVKNQEVGKMIIVIEESRSKKKMMKKKIIVKKVKLSIMKINRYIMIINI